MTSVSSAQEFEARILVVEDDPEARATLDLLLGAKWGVTAVERGDVALDTARALSFDLVLANAQMPGLSGIELAKRSPASRRAPTTSWSSRSRDASCWSAFRPASS